MKSVKTKFKFSRLCAFSLLLGILILIGIVSFILIYAKIKYKDTTSIAKNFDVTLSDNHNSRQELENQFQQKVSLVKIIKSGTLYDYFRRLSW